MSIGDLYNANNVVVGQAATFFAPKNTPLPAFTRSAPSIIGWNQSDPFDAGYLLPFLWASGTATSVIFTYTLDDRSFAGVSLTVAGTSAALIQANLIAALAAVGGSAATISVQGTSPNWNIVFRGALAGGTLTKVDTGGVSTVTSPLWVPCGATDQGWQYGAAKSTQTINIEEQSTPVATTVTSQAVTIAGALSEDITRTLNLALNAQSTVTAPATGVAGFDTVIMTDTVLQYAVVMVTTNPEGFGRIIYAPAWTQLANVTANFRRASDKRSYGVQFSTVCATNLIQTFNFTVAGL